MLLPRRFLRDDYTWVKRIMGSEMAPDSVDISRRPVGAALVEELRHAAVECGERPFLTIDGIVFTFRQAWDHAMSVAIGLRRNGLSLGDRVAILTPNRAEAVWAWFGTLAAGGVDVPLNAESRGSQLAYLLSDCDPHTVIASAELLKLLGSSNAPTPPVVVALDGEDHKGELGPGPRYLTWDSLTTSDGDDPASGCIDIPIQQLGDLASIVYTSGTTGPSKGVMWPHGYYPAAARLYGDWAGFSRDTSIFCAQPLYHLDARSSVVVALYQRGRTTLAERFSASRFWNEVSEAGANAFVFIGTMLQLLAKQSGNERPQGAPTLVGIGTAIPAKSQREFEARFGVRLLEGYGTTEIPLILACRRDHEATGTVGTPADGMQVMLLDDADLPVVPGDPGLLCVRPRIPFSMTLGYWAKPESTAEAFRDLWFHTGDVLRELDNGGFEYIGRQKDSIRRRGENISAWEVEQAALGHVDVMDCAAIGVPSEVGDEDVALLVVLRPGTSVLPQSLVEFMGNDLPRFAAPRFVEFVESLPKTPSERVNKAEVRARGLSASAVDLAPGR